MSGIFVGLQKVLQGAPPRGRQLCFTFPGAPDPLFKASKAPFLTLRVATTRGGHPVKDCLRALGSAKLFALANRGPTKRIRDVLKALETTTAIKRRKISCSFGSDCCDSSFHGCWLGIVVVWRLLWVPLLPLNDGRVEKSSFHGCYHFGTSVQKS